MSKRRYNTYSSSDRFEDIDDKFNDISHEANRLIKENKRLRDERNRYRDEAKDMRNESKDLAKKYETKMQEVVEDKNYWLQEFNCLKQKSTENLKKYEMFGNEVHVYREKKRVETETLKDLLQFETNSKKTLEETNRALIQEKEKLLDQLNAEKKRVQQNWSAKSSEMNKKIVELNQMNSDLKVKLSLEVSKCDKKGSQKDVKDLKRVVMDLEHKLKEQMAVNSTLEKKYSDEVQQLKSGFDLQMKAMKQQRSHFENYYESNKRKLLAAQYIGSEQKNILGSNASEINCLVDKNSDELFDVLSKKFFEMLNSEKKKFKTENVKGVAQVVRNNIESNRKAVINGNKIMEKTTDGSVKCPDCDQTCDGLTNLRIHLSGKHFKKMDPNGEVVESEAEKILAFIELEDD